jgi:hypothetical protein
VTYGTRPSKILGIRNRREAYWFDTAVLATASAAPVEADKPKQYSEPTALFGAPRQVEIRPDGTWD